MLSTPVLKKLYWQYNNTTYFCRVIGSPTVPSGMKRETGANPVLSP
jgi:hypothetical protein